MKQITARLALSQLKINRKRTVVTVIGIVLSVSMMTAVCGFAVSGIEAMRDLVGDEYIGGYQSVFISLSLVLGAIIMTASVVVISNAFRISAAERIRQFGILKSVGATKRQITRSVLNEGVFLCVVSIPAGIAVGLLIQRIGTGIGDVLLSPMNQFISNGQSIHMRFIFSWPVIFLSLTVSFATVMLSAWLPARKAAAIPAIEAIRMTREIRMRKKKLRASKLVEAVFGFEGTLAVKAIKRSRRSYRAMVLALAISVVLFLVCGSLDRQLTMTINQTYNNVDANSFTLYFADPAGEDDYRKPLDFQSMQRLTDALGRYPDTRIYAVGIDDFYTASASDTALTDTMRSTLDPDTDRVAVSLVMTDRAHYEALCGLAGVDFGSNILINSMQAFVRGKTTEFQPLRFSGQTLLLDDDGTETEITLHGQLTGVQVPQEIALSAGSGIIVLVPDCQSRVCYWYGVSADLPGYIAYAEHTMKAFFAFPQEYPAHTAYNVTDITAVTDMTRSLTRLISLFMYGFVGMLTLIGLTSVISAISANVRLRAREFAMLASVGMTQGGMRKMLALESILSAFKALLIGIPLGSAGVYLTYLSVTTKVDFLFSYPWATLLEAVAAVFLIALITTQYAATKLRNASVMDVIRMGEGI